MAKSHIVSGLVAKHTEPFGIIQFHQTELERVTSALKPKLAWAAPRYILGDIMQRHLA